MTQREPDKKITDYLMTNLIEIEKQIQDIKKELDEFNKVESKIESRCWKPEYNETYFFIDDTGIVRTSEWSNDQYDLWRFAISNIFKTKEEAEFEVERLKVIAELKEFAEPDDREWDSNAGQWNIIYNHNENDVRIEHWTYIQANSIYFKSREQAREAIKAVGKDRIKKYYLRVRE